MKLLIGFIIIGLLGIGVLALATNHAEWSRHSIRGGELIIDSARGIDLSDKKLIDRIIFYVEMLRSREKRDATGFKCDVVYDFEYERVSAGIGRTYPKFRIRCKSGCYDYQEWEKMEYGVRKRHYNLRECRGDF